jgi:hypothetical protein
MLKIRRWRGQGSVRNKQRIAYEEIKSKSGRGSWGKCRKGIG